MSSNSVERVLSHSRKDWRKIRTQSGRMIHHVLEAQSSYRSHSESSALAAEASRKRLGEFAVYLWGDQVSTDGTHNWHAFRNLGDNNIGLGVTNGDEYFTLYPPYRRTLKAAASSPEMLPVCRLYLHQDEATQAINILGHSGPLASPAEIGTQAEIDGQIMF